MKKIKRHTILLFSCLLLLCISTELSAQELRFIRSFPLEQKADLVSADNQGNVFIATPRGEIQKYNPEGQLQNTYSPQSASHFTVLQARSTMQILAFDENNQQLIFLDRFLNPASAIALPSDELGFVNTLTLAAGNTLWLADAAAGKLRHWRYDTRQLLLSLNLNQLLNASELEIRELHEHQHKLYLFSPNQVYIFDQLGNFEQQFSTPSFEAIAFTDKQLIGLKNNRKANQQLVSINLYSGEEQYTELPENKKYSKLLYSKGALYLFWKGGADVYRPTP